MLQKQFKKKMPFLTVTLYGHGNCLSLLGLPLTVRLRPLSLKMVMTRPDMLQIVEKYMKPSADTVKKLRSEAKAELEKMNLVEKLESLSEIAETGGQMLIDYTVDAGYVLPDFLAHNDEFKKWTQGEMSDYPPLNEFFPTSFVKTLSEESSNAEREEVAEAEAKSAGNVYEQRNWIATERLTELEQVEVLHILREIAGNLQSSNEPIIEIESEEGGEMELITPVELNSFPENV